jgi:hypothetical protein
MVLGLGIMLRKCDWIGGRRMSDIELRVIRNKFEAPMHREPTVEEWTDYGIQKGWLAAALYEDGTPIRKQSMSGAIPLWVVSDE